MNLLLLEDDHDLGHAVAGHLGAAGHAVHWCQRIADARDAPAPDLALLDLHLPDGDGAALLARLSAEGVALPPAIVLTADATAQARERALRAGAAAVLTKPLDLRQFHQELARCLR